MNTSRQELKRREVGLKYRGPLPPLALLPSITDERRKSDASRTNTSKILKVQMYYYSIGAGAGGGGRGGLWEDSGVGGHHLVLAAKQTARPSFPMVT